jgi:protein gp37
MSDSSAIQWTETTWNPTTGCDRISDGCDNCYALTLAKRLKAMGQAKYQNDGDPRTSGPGFGLTVHPDTLDAPYRWRKPRKVFVNSMSDLFHARVPLTFIQDVFRVMADTPQHSYQVLTKRALRLRRLADRLPWPENVWMGVSVENRDETDRIGHLSATPAKVKFLSCEPLLADLGDIDLTEINWCIVGGESGRNARPMNPGWARSIMAQCRAADVPFFMKQMGEWRPLLMGDYPPPGPTMTMHLPGAVLVRHGGHNGDPRLWPTDLRVREFPQQPQAGAA